jgi:hypothetical protein
MKTNLLQALACKPVLFGAFAVSLSSLTLLSAWDVPDPGSDGEDVNIPDGKLVASGPVISQNGTANTVGDVTALIAGNDNNLYRTGSSNDVAKGLCVGYQNDLSTSTFSSSYAGVIGYNNDVRTGGSITVGNDNLVTSSATTFANYAKFTNVLGLENVVTGASYCTLLSGRDNIVNADYSVAIGQDNTLEGATTGSKTNNSGAVGQWNHIMSDKSWTMGLYNEVSSNETMALGKGLEADAIGCTFVGEFNAATGASLTTRASDEPVFVIGNGTADNARSTAFTVLRDGGVVMSRAQGDISMGDFDN